MNRFQHGQGTGVGVEVGCSSASPLPTTDAITPHSLIWWICRAVIQTKCMSSLHGFFFFMSGSITGAQSGSFSTVGKWTSTHPSTLSSNELVIFSLDTSPAASIIVLLFKVGVIFQLLWCLWETQRQNRANSQRERNWNIIRLLNWQLKRAHFFDFMPRCAKSGVRDSICSCFVVFSIQCLNGRFSSNQTEHITDGVVTQVIYTIFRFILWIPHLLLLPKVFYHIKWQMQKFGIRDIFQMNSINALALVERYRTGKKTQWQFVLTQKPSTKKRYEK